MIPIRVELLLLTYVNNIQVLRKQDVHDEEEEFQLICTSREGESHLSRFSLARLYEIKIMHVRMRSIRIPY